MTENDRESRHEWLRRDWQRPVPTAEQIRVDLRIAVVAAVISPLSVELWRSAFGADMGWQGVEAYLWTVLASLALAGRRRAPLITVIVGSVIFLLMGVRLGEVIGVFTVQMLLFATIYAAWAWSRYPRALVLVSAGIVTAMFVWLAVQFIETDGTDLQGAGAVPPVAAVIVYSFLINIVYFFGAMAWGQAAYLSARRRAVIAEQAERERSLERARRRQAVEAERLRIARDLHDVVAHHVSAIGVQAAGAGRVLNSDPTAAATALGSIETSARQAVSQMHQLVGLLRGADTDEPGPRLGLADLPGLTGVGPPRIDLRIVGDEFAVPDSIAGSLYRVAQEAVTNVGRHAQAREASLTVRYLPEEAERPRSVEVEIVDDGRGPPSSWSSGGGFGLEGIRERAVMHGGQHEIGPRPHGGFRVRVRVPIAGETRVSDPSASSSVRIPHGASAR